MSCKFTAVLGALLSLLPMLGSAAPVTTKELTFRFSDAKAAGKLKVQFISQNVATMSIVVEVDIPANTNAATKRDLVAKAIKDEFKKQRPDDPEPKVFTYTNEVNPPKGTEGLVLGNIPLMIKTTLLGLNARVNSGKTKEGRDGLLTSALDPQERGFIRFSGDAYDPGDNGAPASFHAGFVFDNVVYEEDFTTDPLGPFLTGREIAHRFWLELEAQISALAYFPDPGLTDSDTLWIQPFSTGLSVFGVEFGTTSPTGEVVGGIQSTVPEPASQLLFGTAALLLCLVRRRRTAPRCDRRPGVRAARARRDIARLRA